MKKLIFILIFFMTGCWNYHELNDLAIVTAMAIDKKDNKYEVSILIANSKKNESSNTGESQTIVYSGIGKNIEEALNEIDLISPKKIYIEHLSTIIISKEIAKDGIVNIMDFFLRNSESTKRFQIILADNAKDVIKIINPLETFPASSISKNLNLSDDTQTKSVSVLYSEFSYKLLEKGIEPILPTIEIKGNSKKGSQNDSLEQTTPKAIVKLSNMAILKKDKYIKTLTSEESEAINIVNNKANELNIYIPCSDNYTTLKTQKMNSKIKIINPQKREFEIDVNLDSSIIEDNCSNDLTKNSTIKILKKKGTKIIKNKIQKIINVAIKYKTDIFGFGNLLYKKYPKLYNKNWNNELDKIKVKIKVNLNIRFKGSAKENIREVLNEN